MIALNWKAVDIKFKYFAIDSYGNGRVFVDEPTMSNTGWYDMKTRHGREEDGNLDRCRQVGKFNAYDWINSVQHRYAIPEDYIDLEAPELSGQDMLDIVIKFHASLEYKKAFLEYMNGSNK